MLYSFNFATQVSISGISSFLRISGILSEHFFHRAPLNDYYLIILCKLIIKTLSRIIFTISNVFLDKIFQTAFSRACRGNGFCIAKVKTSSFTILKILIKGRVIPFKLFQVNTFYDRKHYTVLQTITFSFIKEDDKCFPLLSFLTTYICT